MYLGNAEFTPIGKASVDSGMLMVCDPCYVLDENALISYGDLCDKIGNSQFYEIKNDLATVISTPYGDGTYEVYAVLEKGSLRGFFVDLIGSGVDSNE